MFDYLFYRLHAYFKRSEKQNGPISFAALNLTFIQLLLVYLVYTTTAVFTDNRYSILALGLEKSVLQAIFIVVFLGVDLLNYFKYKRLVMVLEARYRNHPLNKKLKLWMIMLLCWGIIFFPFGLKAILRAL